ncbi:MAG: hypothetical protein CR960_00385 [Pasteurellales bacterium]|nr:MAG: hypothetical protein CR960_00385 [Pasteurellales bacterium]
MGYLRITVSFFIKNYKFPVYCIGILLGSFVFIILDSLLLVVVFKDFISSTFDLFGQKEADEIRHIIYATIVWISYINTSQRVKNTFLEKRPVE